MYQIDNQSRQAVYEQIVRQVEKYVLTGVLNSGDKLPSVRSMSIELNVNPNTVQRAYTELERSGVIVTAPGRGAFVSENGVSALKERRTSMYFADLKRLVAELMLCRVEKDRLITIINDQYTEDEEND
ncbi:MAG: GntR family transcriptional regulator [Oscillospiraceae bacterium]|nr:GntR family transcriptional regulator [Oscillospiraceae bacterium]